MGQGLPPANSLDGLFQRHRFRLRPPQHMLTFGRSDPRVRFGGAVEQQPANQPEKSKRAGQHKGRLPAEPKVDPGDHRRGDDRTDRCPALDQAVDEGPLPRRVPLTDRLKGRHEVSRFAHPQQKPQEPQRPDAPHKRMGHIGQRPPDHEQAQRGPRAEPIDEQA